MTFGEEGGETADKGSWMSIWVDDVYTVHTRCIEQNLDVTFLRPTCLGKSAKCTSANPTATSSASAAESKE